MNVIEGLEEIRKKKEREAIEKRNRIMRGQQIKDIKDSIPEREGRDKEIAKDTLRMLRKAQYDNNGKVVSFNNFAS